MDDNQTCPCHLVSDVSSLRLYSYISPVIDALVVGSSSPQIFIPSAPVMGPGRDVIKTFLQPGLPALDFSLYLHLHATLICTFSPPRSFLQLYPVPPKLRSLRAIYTARPEDFVISCQLAPPRALLPPISVHSLTKPSEMQMDGWTDHLHIALYGEHVLFPAFRLDSTWHFVVASIFTAILCLMERCVSGPMWRIEPSLQTCRVHSTLTYAISKNWTPFSCTRRSRFRRAVWKSVLYWVVTFDRLCVSILHSCSPGCLMGTVRGVRIGCTCW